MKKKSIFWIVMAIVVIAIIVFVKLAPVWVSINSVVSISCGVVIGWWGKMFYDKFIKPVES